RGTNAGPGECGFYSVAWGLVTGGSNGLTFYVDVFNSHGGITQVVTPEIPADQIWDDNWHAIAGVFDGGRAGSRRVVSLWIDGRQVSAVDLPADLSSPDGTIAYPSGTGRDQIQIARRSAFQAQNCPGIVPREFHGSIDEIQIYHRALTASQIAQLQDASAVTPPDVSWTPQTQGPSLSGTPKVGQQLTCTDRDGLIGTPHESNPPSYTWERAPRDPHFENDSAW